MNVESKASFGAERELRPTHDLAAWVAGVEDRDIPEIARRWATDAVIDWFAVTLPGSLEPLSRKLADLAIEEGAGPGRLIGRSEKVSLLNAALVNGAASHALDYDDVNTRMMGHPTVPVVPALLAIAEGRKVSGAEFLTAFIAGYETECLTVEMIGLSHYDLGWHTTATIGTLGAAAAAARLLGCSAEQTEHALGLAVAQAAGLKSMFGTMAKPFQVGKASMNGLLAARLAMKGMTARTDAIECAQGLAATQSRTFAARPVRPGGNESFAVEENLFKYHAACYLTHSPIEAALRLRQDHGIGPADIDRVTVTVGEYTPTVCNIPDPATGLEIKFSLRHTVAMALAGLDTAALGSYTDEIANDGALVDLRNRVTVETRAFESRTEADVTVATRDGRNLAMHWDVGIPASDIEGQRRGLVAKFRSLVDPVLGEERSKALLERLLELDRASDMREVIALACGS